MVTHIQLELAPGPVHPFGDGRYVYHLYLPISGDGHLDPRQMQGCDRHCRFRCQRPGQCELRGAIRIGETGDLCLHCDDPACSGRVVAAPDACRFRPGDVLPIAEEPGRNVDLFQVLWTRQE